MSCVRFVLATSLAAAATALLAAQDPGHAPAPREPREPSPVVVELANGETLTRRERVLAGTLSPIPPVPPQPSNRVADDPAAAAFGQRLFFDTRLSRDGDQSCASCHDPAIAWTDGKARSLGRAPLLRNSPSLLLAGHQRWLFWDGRADSLWSQVQWPLEHPDEMGFARADLVRLLASDAALRAPYEALFGPLPDGAADPERFRPGGRPPLPTPSLPFQPAPTLEQLAERDPGHAAWLAMNPADRDAANRVLANVGKAIAAFERKLVPGPAPFDVFVEGLEEDDRDKQAALSAEAVRGFKLFVGRGECINCHFSPLFSGGEFHNIGLPGLEGDPVEEGRPHGIRTVEVDPLNGRGAYSDARDWDDNVKLRYLNYDDHTYGAWKAPSLRNVARTAPYMHDGRFATLEDVLDFYSELPGRPPIGHREETLRRLDLNEAERADLIAFLASLSGEAVAAELRTPPPLPRDD